MKGLYGMRVVVSPHLPTTTYPDHKEDGRRIVRHGMAEILEWLGEEVGLAPGEPEVTHAYVFGEARTILASAEYVELIGKAAKP